jgi:hypothetical protein
MKAARLIPALAIVAAGQQQTAPPVQFICPMDRDVRSDKPGRCPRCGMALEAGIQEPLRYRMNLAASPSAIPAGKPGDLRFEILDPRDGKRAVSFESIHEKLFHLFVVGADLEYFAHQHPELGQDGSFHLTITLPRPGIYRLLADFYPSGGTPQLLPAFITTAGFNGPISSAITTPAEDLSPKQAANMKIEMRTDPVHPMPGRKTMLFFRFDSAEGLEPYLGAWGHLLSASNDLVDAIHEHPAFAPNGREIQFNVFFPREAVYRIWVQFQRNGVVNTAEFTVPVRTDSVPQ